MKKQINFPSIDQFRTIVANVNRRYNYVGSDENGDPIYDDSLPKPTLTFKGTVKLHGTNSAVSCNNVAGMWAQSRENIITPEKDNAGFAWFMECNKVHFKALIDKVASRENVDLDKNTITIYGEWIGRGIQKGVAIAELEKSMFIFGVKVSPFDSVDSDVDNGEEVKTKSVAYWVDYGDLRVPETRIYNIDDYKTYSIEIDFNYPQLAQNKMIEMTIEVENECPVGKAFGISDVGEGIVFTASYNGDRYVFKSKGERHSTSKVKTLVSVDIEKLNSLKEFVEYAVTENRVNQAIGIVFPNNEPLEMKKIGDVLRWIVNDILKEETDTMMANGLEPKEVSKHIPAKAKEFFMKRLTQF
jgi:hypothetical protein